MWNVDNLLDDIEPIVINLSSDSDTDTVSDFDRSDYNE